MKLKYLSICVVGLSFGGCSSHVIKSNSLAQDQTSTQRVIQGVNAVYDYPNFDYRGALKINLAQNAASLKKQPKRVAEQLDPALQLKVNQYLKQQNIHLTQAQKQALYQSMSSSTATDMRDIFGKGSDVAENILNDVQFNYDGTVNYRQKIATFNLDTKYQKQNLLVQARIPSVIDFKESKFYTNIFSIMPYLANRQDQTNFAYYDFSEYKDDISNINPKALVEFLKESSATTYLLSPANQIKTIGLSAEEKSKGAVEKIRVHSTVEEIMQQSELYLLVNRQYLMSTVLKIDAAKMSKLLGETSDDLEAEENSSADEASSEAIEAAQEASEAADAAGLSEAEQAMYDLHSAMNRHLYNEDHSDPESADEESTEENAVDAAADAVDAAAEATVDAADATASVDAEESEVSETEQATDESLSVEQCSALASDASKARIGDVQYCQYYYSVNLLAKDTAIASEQDKTAQKTKLKQIFSEYDQNSLMNAEEFKQLWHTHAADIEAAMPSKEKRTPLIIDVLLDAQGRATQMDYDMAIDFGKLNRQMNVNVNLEILNYGNATKIDRQALNQAKSFKEAFKGSFIEKFAGGMSQSRSENNDETEDSSLSWEEQLQDLARKVYLQTGSYEKTYKAVFIAKLTAEHPELVKQYSTQDLQEIAAIYAFIHSDEDVYNLQGEALKKIEALQDKHHLEQDAQFDRELGSDVNNVVIEVLTVEKDRLEIQKLMKKYNNAEAVFTAFYVQTYKAENEPETSEHAALQSTAKVLAKAYVALSAQKFDQKIIQSLDEDASNFIDYAIFKQSYQAMLDAKVK